MNSACFESPNVSGGRVISGSWPRQKASKPRCTFEGFGRVKTWDSAASEASSAASSEGRVAVAYSARASALSARFRNSVYDSSLIVPNVFALIRPVSYTHLTLPTTSRV